MNHFIKQSFCLTLILSILLVCTTSVLADEKSQKTVRVAFPQQSDLTEVQEDGSYAGYTFDYLDKIAQITGWKMEYISIEEPTLDASLTKALKMVQSGEADLIGGLVKNDTLLKQYELTNNSYGIMYSALAAKEDNLTLNSSNFMNKSPLRIGIWGKGDVTENKLMTFFKDYNTNYEFVRYDRYLDMMEAFNAGQIDLIPDSSIGSVKGTQQFAIYASEPFYFAATKGQTTLIQELDEAINQLNLSFPYFQSDLGEKYLNNTRGSFFIADSEKSYLKSKKVISAICVPDCAPFVFQDDNGNWKGIAVSMIEDFAAKTGLTVEYTKFDRTINFATAFKSGDYDCILGIPINDKYNNAVGVITSSPYLKTQLVYFSKHGSPQKKDSESIVAALKGSDLEESLGYKEVRYYENTEDCIQAVLSGEVDYGYGNQYCVEYYAQHNYLSLTIVPLVGETRNLEISVSKSENPALLSLLNRYIDHLDSADIYEFHVAANAEHPTDWFKTLRYSDPVKFGTLMAVLLFAIFFAVAMWFFAKNSKKKNLELQRMTDAKSDFLSRVSHDMRTPMNAILSFSSMELDATPSPEQLQEDMAQINRSGQYLLGLINDVLDMSKIENSKMALYLEPVRPSECLKGILSTVAPLMEKKHIQFHVDIDLPHTEPILMLDMMRTKQLFINLLSNAAKFTPKGGTVSFKLTSTEWTDDHVVLNFCIRDTGIGMSTEFQKHLFEPFSQEHSEASGQLTGTGLGLSIVKQLVDLMDGSITVNSTAGVGTEFNVTLRHSVVPEATPSQDTAETNADQDGAACSDAAEQENVIRSELTDAAKNPLKDKRVLLCEDHPVNAEIAKRLLSKYDMKTDLAENGQDGVDTFNASEPGYYDVILMDIKMPILDGLQAAAAIRVLNRKDAASIPIVAVTANAFDEDVQKSIKAGMNAHISKPINPEELHKILMSLLT